MKRLNKMIVCLGGVLVFSMGLNFSVQTIYAQEMNILMRQSRLSSLD
jgi:Phr family secreted Rap phosphatase inhibitor